MQMDLSFVQPDFYFAQIEVYESQSKRMIGKIQYGEGFQKQLSIVPLVTGSQAPCNISGCCGLGWEPFQGDLVLPPFRGVLCSMNHGSISVESKGGHHLREP